MATRPKQQTSPIDVQSHLSGVDYPADRNELIDHAYDQDAPEDVISALESLPDRTFDSPTDVSSELSNNH